ncbi:MAG: transcriptional regulator [Chloroflexi bacterium]|nr:transcriptional regulator [Chloroflexota bacterium]
MTVKIHPIRDEADYDAALHAIETLWDAAPGTPRGDALDVLTTLVAVYEDEHHPVPPPDPIEAIQHYLESRGLTRRDLEPYFGSRARVSEVLARRRRLTLPMIRRLKRGLGIPADVLIQPYDLR